MHESKMSHHSGPAAGFIQLAIVSLCVCLCVTKRERQRKRMWGTSASLYCRSLPHFSLLSLLYNPIFFPSFPSCNPSLPFLSLLRRGLVSPWPVGTEKQPQWLEDCSSTTTRGRSSSPGSTEMTLGTFHGTQSCCNVPTCYLGFGGERLHASEEGRDPLGVDRLIPKRWERIMFPPPPAKEFTFVCFVISSKMCFRKIAKPGLHLGLHLW